MEWRGMWTESHFLTLHIHQLTRVVADARPCFYKQMKSEPNGILTKQLPKLGKDKKEARREASEGTKDSEVLHLSPD